MEAGRRPPIRPSHQLSPQPNSFLSRTGTPPAADSSGPCIRSSSFLTTQSSPCTAALCTVRSRQRSNPSPSYKLELAINSPASPPSPPILFSHEAPPESTEFIADVRRPASFPGQIRRRRWTLASSLSPTPSPCHGAPPWPVSLIQSVADQEECRRPKLTAALWYVSNLSIIFDAPCLFLHHLPCVSLHFMAFLCDFWN
jgi:hypothetical protein